MITKYLDGNEMYEIITNIKTLENSGYFDLPATVVFAINSNLKSIQSEYKQYEKTTNFLNIKKNTNENYTQEDWEKEYSELMSIKVKMELVSVNPSVLESANLLEAQVLKYFIEEE